MIIIIVFITTIGGSPVYIMVLNYFSNTRQQNSMIIFIHAYINA